MVLEEGAAALEMRDVPDPAPGPGELLLQVSACGVCRTDLHILDGDLPRLARSVIPGHEIVGTVIAHGAGADRFRTGDRVGVPWLGETCGTCRYCCRSMENLCERARFTGYTLPGGYSELVVANERYCFGLPDAYDDAHAAPLLCAGLIGYRSYRMIGNAHRIGLYGFGAAAHIVAQIAVQQGHEVYAFVRPGDHGGMSFASRLGATWAGGSDEPSPRPLDAAIIFAPVGALIPRALRSVDRGCRVVCAGIHMSEIPAFPYEILWYERQLRSVANLTRRDGDEFMNVLAGHRVETVVKRYPLERANDALSDLREGRLSGAAVLEPGGAA
jgi:propanol-preferring alcohol dehydrogenase